MNHRALPVWAEFVRNAMNIGPFPNTPARGSAGDERPHATPYNVMRHAPAGSNASKTPLDITSAQAAPS